MKYFDGQSEFTKILDTIDVLLDNFCDFYSCSPSIKCYNTYLIISGRESFLMELKGGNFV